MKYHFTKHFSETIKSRYGIELTGDVKNKLIANIGTATHYKRSLKGREPEKLVYLGDPLYEYIAVAYEPKTQTFITALRIGMK